MLVVLMINPTYRWLWLIVFCCNDYQSNAVIAYYLLFVVDCIDHQSNVCY
jgi:hypothetical protein